MDAIDTPVQRVCGHEYQEGDATTTALPLCECGTFSIGICHKCGRPVCGLHSALDHDRRLCTDDLRDVRAKRRIAGERIAANVERQRQERATADRDASAARLQAIQARKAALPAFTTDDLIPYLLGQIGEVAAQPESSSGVVERVLAPLRSGDVAAALTSFGRLPARRHTVSLPAKRGRSKPSRVEGWVFCTAVGVSAPAEVPGRGGGHRSHGLLLARDGRYCTLRALGRLDVDAEHEIVVADVGPLELGVIGPGMLRIMRARFQAWGLTSR